MSNLQPRQCGLFIVILSSTLSLKTVVFFYPLLFLRLLSPRLKYSRLALCMNALPYTRYCQGTKLNTQDTLKSISKEIGFFYFDLKSELSRQRLKFKSKDGN